MLNIVLLADHAETIPTLVQWFRTEWETARMYTGPFSDISLHRLYGVTSFEIG
jgi:hypothetical protein